MRSRASIQSLPRTLAILVVLAALVPLALTAGAEETAIGDAYRAALEPYEEARAALAADRLDPARDAGDELERILGRITGGGLSPESAGVAADDLAEVRDLLPELEAAAASLASAADLDAARDAFYALTKPLVRWRQAVGAGPSVLYCPMVKRSWLQPGDEVGNPYYGPRMLDCGERVGG